MHLLGKHFGQGYPESIVDIGANDPLKLNNTYFFEKLFQTKVYSFEPNTELTDRWKSVHPHSIISFVGISSEVQKLQLKLPVKQQLEGVDTHVFDSLSSGQSKLNKYDLLQSREIEVEVGPLSKYLTPGQYDALFTDTEGHELEVLKGIDFKQFSFKVVVIENNDEPGGNRAIRKKMQQEGYRLVMRSYASMTILCVLPCNINT